MAAPMVKTRTPGVYRRGSRYVVVYYVNGRQRRESARTYDEARRLKSGRQADVARGEFHEASKVKFAEYATEWVERHDLADSSRDDYRSLLKRYALPFFDERLGRTLAQITPQDVANYIHWLSQQKTRRDKPLTPGTVQKALNPVRACLETAKREGLIRHNPTNGARIPKDRRVLDDEAEDVRPLTREQLAAFLQVIHPKHRLMFRFLASTGLRVSELIALQWKHLQLDGESPHVRIRRTYVRGREQRPKTKHSVREVPLGPDLVFALRRHRRDSEWNRNDDLVFPSEVGKPILVENLRRRHLRPAAEEAGAPWAGFHTFRHTCASLLFERGANAKQVQRWLGHHSAAFTLDTYIHLLGDELGEPLELSAELAGDNKVTTDPTASDVTTGTVEPTESAA
jgi:integrase